MKRSRGFTLIELLSVVAILVIIVVLCMYAIVSAQERARIVVCSSNLRQIHSGVAAYAITYSGWYPLYGEMNNGDVVGLGLGEMWAGITSDGTRYSGPPAGGTGSVTFGPTGFGNCLIRGPTLFTVSWQIYYCPTFQLTQGFESATKFWSNQANWDSGVRIPNMGYNYFNGNSPGYIHPEGYSTTNPPPSGMMLWSSAAPSDAYQGKPVYATVNNAPRRFANNGGTFAAGFITDPPGSIIMADIAGYYQDPNPPKLNHWMKGTDRFDNPVATHDSGFNSLFNDGSVRFATYKTPNGTGDLVDTSAWYAGNHRGSSWAVAGPK